MRRTGTFLGTLALLALAGPAAQAADGPLYIAPELAISPDAGITQKLANCPYPAQFSTTLSHTLAHQGATFTNDPLPTPSGRSLKVVLTDLVTSGNGFIGHQQYLKLRGTLYQDGKEVASFTDRAQFQDGGLETACHSIRMLMKAEAWYVGRWVKHPVDGQELKHFGE